MNAILVKLQSEKKEEANELLTRRLSVDMFPMGQQFTTAASFSMRACCWLQGVELFDFGQDAMTIESLTREISETRNYIDTLDEGEFGGWEQKTIDLIAGQTKRTLSGRELVEIYALPNFFFHMSMGYAILRQCDIDIGKSDFDGLHVYEKGFCFDS